MEGAPRSISVAEIYQQQHPEQTDRKLQDLKNLQTKITQGFEWRTVRVTQGSEAQGDTYITQKVELNERKLQRLKFEADNLSESLGRGKIYNVLVPKPTTVSVSPKTISY